MIFNNISLNDARLITLEPHIDKRGLFTRTFCKNEFSDNGIDFSPVQSSISYNKFVNTIRGLHYQENPYEEAKIVSCIRGAIYDVIVDLRKESSTYKKWFSIKLDYSNMLYIPKGFAHGFQTLFDETYILYYMDKFYNEEHSKTIKWNSPDYKIKWLWQDPILSDKDLR